MSYSVIFQQGRGSSLVETGRENYIHNFGDGDPIALIEVGEWEGKGGSDWSTRERSKQHSM